jgi:zinc-ribbon domain
MPFCPECGKTVLEDQKFCPSCGKGLKAQDIPSVPEKRAPGPAAASPPQVQAPSAPVVSPPTVVTSQPEPVQVNPHRPAWAKDGVWGTVRNLKIGEILTGNKNYGDPYEREMTFILERYDRNGNRIDSIPVLFTYSARSTSGIINNGDTVWIKGSRDKSGMLRATRMYNETVNYEFKGGGGYAGMVLGIIGAIVLLFIGFLLISSNSVAAILGLPLLFVGFILLAVTVFSAIRRRG